MSGGLLNPDSRCPPASWEDAAARPQTQARRPPGGSQKADAMGNPQRRLERVLEPKRQRRRERGDGQWHCALKVKDIALYFSIHMEPFMDQLLKLYDKDDHPTHGIYKISLDEVTDAV